MAWAIWISCEIFIELLSEVCAQREKIMTVITCPPFELIWQKVKVGEIR